MNKRRVNNPKRKLRRCAQTRIGATGQTLVMTAAEQLTFWTALNQPVNLTATQKTLGKLMRGES